MNVPKPLLIKDILLQHSLRLTACRSSVLDLFLSAQHALAHADLEKTLAPAYDRVTLYRTLKTFLEKNIIHKVLDDSGNLKYAIQKDVFASEHPSHIHFKCNRCGTTNCLEDVQIPILHLPAGYQLSEANLLVQGVCDLCNKYEL